MTDDIFKTRERALEDAFFREVDQQLLQRMKDDLKRDEQRESLISATGITDEKVLSELIGIGIKSETILALWLFPLVWVAWADGHIDQQQRNDILEAAHQAGHERGSASHQLIESWLEFPPDPKLKDAWKDYVGSVCGVISPSTLQTLKQDILNRSRKIAELSSFHFNFDDVEKSQYGVIAQIEKSFATE